jgi:hypothetical protein
MRSTDEASVVSSALPDLRKVSSAGMPCLTTATVDKVLQRFLPGFSSAQVPVSAFGSAI